MSEKGPRGQSWPVGENPKDGDSFQGLTDLAILKIHQHCSKRGLIIVSEESERDEYGPVFYIRKGGK